MKKIITAGFKDNADIIIQGRKNLETDWASNDEMIVSRTDGNIIYHSDIIRSAPRLDINTI